MRLGAHLSIAKGLLNTVTMAAEIKANTFQFFTRNPRGGAARTIPANEITAWQEVRKKFDLYPIAGHLPYTVNLGAALGRQQEFARMVLYEDTLRVAAIGGEYLITHPGHHDGDREAALKRIIQSIEEAYLSIPDPVPMLLLETMAGQGKEIGSLEDLRFILAGLGWPERVGVCLDSAHLFASGWELRTLSGCSQLVKELETSFGLEKVKVMHLNDSLVPLGSHRDRHAGIGRGELGREGIANIVNDRFFSTLTLILETPVKNYKEYGDEIALVKQLNLDDDEKPVL
ncbi:deoxyribonuclease IV [Neomoorella humiferrea]|uniref:deoxyribonuclease IV n=1 Tax=Neomoorella humiferrea TaxID=676965 RepID=UPI003D8A2912